MPLIQIGLTPDEDKLLDKIAKSQKRAKRQQAHVLLVERMAEIEAVADDALKTQRERDLATDEHLSSLRHPPKPRFFRSHEFGSNWRWDGREMLTGHGEKSLFVSPDDIMSAIDVFEVDEWGSPIADDSDDVAGARGDYECKLQKEQDL